MSKTISMYEFVLEGTLQGVGFRPFVYNRCVEFGLVGFVQNIGIGVKILVDDAEKMKNILEQVPINAKIDTIKVVKVEVPHEKYASFEIKESEQQIGDGSAKQISIPSDIGTCDECLKELREEGNLRERYFFISCVNCGPRYSILENLPFDRNNTTLKKFELCSDCKGEYRDSSNRRFHAQTIACSKCGPQLNLYVNDECCPSFKKLNVENPIKKVAELLKKGEIVAIKGIGGFHLACNITRKSVDELKRVLKREYKPFALMGRDLEMIRKFVKVSKIEREVLLSPVKPIVLLEKLDLNGFEHISELSSLGFMLPYTGLHSLLFDYLDEPIVLTSSNMPSMPMTVSKDEQFVKYVLDYNRDISNFVDDSIVKVVREKSLVIRKSRGMSVDKLKIPSNFLLDEANDVDVVACGSEMKNTVSIRKGNYVYLSQHIGNTYNLEMFDLFKDTLTKLKDYVGVEPKVILSDMNKSFNVTKFASRFSEYGVEVGLIQHHLAHGFGVAIEHNLRDFVAIVCDGTGFGSDESVWGGEVFHNDVRIGRLEKQPLIGGDVANKEPLRMLVGVLSKFMGKDEVVDVLEDDRVSLLFSQNEQGFNTLQTSSCGRILDCVSLLLGFCDVNYYEGRGAMMLESNSFSGKVKMYLEPVIVKEDGLFVLQTTPLIKFVLENRDAISSDKLARFAQLYLAKGLFEIAQKYLDGSDVSICFTGGVAYNSIMSEFMIERGVLLNKEVPCGDGGVSYGQVAYWLWKEKYIMSNS